MRRTSPSIPVSAHRSHIREDQDNVTWCLVSLRRAAMRRLPFSREYFKVSEADVSVPLVVIRGISDIVGVERQQAWTQYACDTSASLAVSLIKAGHFHPDDSLDLESLEVKVPEEKPAEEPANPALVALRNIGRFGDTDIFRGHLS
jgi:surfactin synthase thioesterase subunit